MTGEANRIVYVDPEIRTYFGSLIDFTFIREEFVLIFSDSINLVFVERSQVEKGWIEGEITFQKMRVVSMENASVFRPVIARTCCMLRRHFNCPFLIVGFEQKLSGNIIQRFKFH